MINLPVAKHFLNGAFFAFRHALIKFNEITFNLNSISFSIQYSP
jgi:hypothetical protein